MSTAEHVTREHFDSTVRELKALIASLAAQPEQSLTLTTAEVCDITGHRNYFGLHAWSKKWKLKQVSKGRYLREDVKLAMARAAFVVPFR